MVVSAAFGIADFLGASQLFFNLRQTGSGGDQLTDDDVLLQTGQRVNLALDGGFGQNAGGFLEGCSGQEAVGCQAGLGDTKQDLTGLDQLQVGFACIITSRRLTTLPMMNSLEPASSMRTLRIIWRTITSICLSLISTPCRR